MIDQVLDVLSFGAGLQTTTLLLMALDGEIAPPDRVVFADTHRESAGTYLNLAAMQARCAIAGVPFDVVSAGDIRADTLAGDMSTRHKQFATAPFYVLDPETGRKSMLRRQCTQTYKIEPIRRLCWQLVGRRSRPGAIRMWRGISWDETQRVRDADVRYIRNVHPLVDLRMTRADCAAWLVSRGYDVPPKSSCIECPFHDNRFWLEMREHRPSEWAEAVVFDKHIRHLPRIKGLCFLHRSCVPLDEAVLRPEDAGQLTMLEELCGADCGV